MHVVLSMSPSGDSLRNYCRSFPGLVGSTTIDWIYPWPKQALKSVARGHIIDNRKIPDDYKEPINDHVVFVHESLQHYSKEFLQILRRRNYVTPKHYLDYVTTYIRLLDEKSSFITKQIARYSDGIKKIDDASAQIDLLRVEVEQTKSEATNAAIECDKVMAEIEKCELTVCVYFVANSSIFSHSPSPPACTNFLSCERTFFLNFLIWKFISHYSDRTCGRKEEGSHRKIVGG